MNTQTLCYYERCGLLTEPERSNGGHRLYGEETSAPAPFGSRWQQWGHPLPQGVRNKVSTHAGHPADQDHRARDLRINPL
ncbi:MerR family DNA-binding transcriptional regulator [Streptomyces virginiae]|uniref:MerR family DNA-binding transcriptional regulator n=1 Tax=Streptomyces virginiae TaxID=1961 RepID=UPI0034234A69